MLTPHNTFCKCRMKELLSIKFFPWEVDFCEMLSHILQLYLVMKSCRTQGDIHKPAICHQWIMITKYIPIFIFSLLHLSKITVNHIRYCSNLITSYSFIPPSSPSSSPPNLLSPFGSRVTTASPFIAIISTFEAINFKVFHRRFEVIPIPLSGSSDGTASQAQFAIKQL